MFIKGLKNGLMKVLETLGYEWKRGNKSGEGRMNGDYERQEGKRPISQWKGLRECQAKRPSSIFSKVTGKSLPLSEWWVWVMVLGETGLATLPACWH